MKKGIFLSTTTKNFFENNWNINQKKDNLEKNAFWGVMNKFQNDCKGCLWSISLTFYVWLFREKVLQAACLYLHFRFELFWSKNIGAKAALRLLVTLTQANCYFCSSLFFPVSIFLQSMMAQMRCFFFCHRWRRNASFLTDCVDAQ